MRQQRCRCTHAGLVRARKIVAGGPVFRPGLGDQRGHRKMLEKVKIAVGLQDEQDKGLLGQIDEAVTLTWKQRFIGFGCCVGFGLVLTLLGILMLWMMRITQFAVLYSFGSIVSVMSTMFLMGPVKQFQRMMEERRIIATIVYFAAIGGTLAVAFTIGSAPLCMIMIVIQFAALVWYVLTWIPGGQAAVKAMIFRSG